LIGYKLVFGRQFSFAIVLVFLLGSSLISVFSAGLAARLGGFRGLDVVNIALTTNARGGPGIVLASVAYDAGIINAAFYTSLVITAVITSQIAGAWLRFVLSKGWPLLSTNPDETWKAGERVAGKAVGQIERA
jgi:Kef-type K+ transport system membrane component KefB